MAMRAHNRTDPTDRQCLRASRPRDAPPAQSASAAPAGPQSLGVDHEVVKVRVIDVLVEEPLDELVAAAVGAMNPVQGFRQARCCRRCRTRWARNASGATIRTAKVFDRGKRNCAPRPTNTALPLRARILDQATDLHHVLLVRNDLPIHPRAQYVVNPVALGLIDQIEHQSRFLVTLGNLIQQVRVVHLPAEVLAHQVGQSSPRPPRPRGKSRRRQPLGRQPAGLLATGCTVGRFLQPVPRFASAVRQRLRSGCPDELNCS